MPKIIKQVIGIDVGSKELVCCLGFLLEDSSKNLHLHRVFKNTNKGFDLLKSWIVKHTRSDLSIYFVMEATGVYHESLAYFLDAEGFTVSVILPNKISNYFKTLDVKTITDKTCSEAITLFGLERLLVKWERPNPIYNAMQQLTRERDQIVTERTMVKNQLHAENAGALPNKGSLKRIKQRIALLDRQEADIKKEISHLIKSDIAVRDKVEIMCSIPGVGLLTAAIVLGETNGFAMIQNRRQLASYAGLDVREKQSGISIKGKPRISKRGNKHLRKAMYLPALAAIRHEKQYKDIFVKLVSKHGIKMKAAVAVQRKILELMYLLFKTNRFYDKLYYANSPLTKETILSI